MQHKVAETGSQRILQREEFVQANRLQIKVFNEAALSVVRTISLTTVLITARTGAAAGSE